jgi:hypothetical protein
MWRRGCLGLLGALIGTFLLVGGVAGIGLVTGVQQPGQVWLISVGRAEFAIGRIVGDTECRRMQARGNVVTCPKLYGATLVLSPRGADQHAAEYTLFVIQMQR